ncbi:MAG: hypothetical protein H7175_05880 [Burkholderiales bacterium]|nr:hypothetical protein [Anaerolineae bacterium]
MLDDLRRAAGDDFDDSPEEKIFDADRSNSMSEEKVDKVFLGMTAVERMFLSIFLFMCVGVLGLALLIATGRIAF